MVFVLICPLRFKLSNLLLRKSFLSMQESASSEPSLDLDLGLDSVTQGLASGTTSQAGGTTTTTSRAAGGMTGISREGGLTTGAAMTTPGLALAIFSTSSPAISRVK